MTPEDIKKAEQRSYANGYNAGRKRRKADIAIDQKHREESAFLDKAFLAALPSCVIAEGWTRGEQKIINLASRTKLAWDFAQEALRQRRGLK